MHTHVLDALREYAPSRTVRSTDLPWIPSPMPGKSSKPLRFLRGLRGFVELLRMEPGIAMPLHRHTGEVHVWNLEGSRELCTGEIIRPGDYVYEPPGHVDAWKTIGDDTMIALVIVMGTVEFLDAHGHVRARASAATQLADYEWHCCAYGLEVRDIVES